MSSDSSARGMRDFLPDKSELREIMRRRIMDSYLASGYRLVSTPAVEKLSTLDAKLSSENSKLMFRIMKRGKKLAESLVGDNELCDLGLRYDLTIPLARYYADHREELPSCGGVFKSLQIGNVWRAERPQKGRFRQFVQCDTDIIGCRTVHAEYELIVSAVKTIRLILDEPVTVYLNDRRLLSALLTRCQFDGKDLNTVIGILDKQDKLGIETVNELLNEQYGSDKANSLRSALEEIKQEVTEILASGTLRKQRTTDTRAYLEDLLDLIRVLRLTLGSKCDVVFDPCLARGIEYYTGIIVEIKMPNDRQAIAGGGRYDGLIGTFSRQSVPACGLSLGFERILERYELRQKDRAAEQSLSERSDLLAVLVPSHLSLGQFVDVVRSEYGGADLSVYPLAAGSVGKQLQSLKQMGYRRCLSYQSSDNSFRLHKLSEWE